jgi:hypothetical protein
VFRVKNIFLRRSRLPDVSLRTFPCPFFSFQDSIEWYKDSLEGPIALKNDSRSHRKITAYSSDLSFGKEIFFNSATLADKGRYICKVAEKSPDYHNPPGKKCTPLIYERPCRYVHRYMKSFTNNRMRMEK